MAEKKRKSAGGAKLQRTETVTIRLDPKMRYLAELASRVQRRTLSSYIEWAIHKSFSQVSLPDSEDTIGSLAESLWDVDDADRFAELALKFPTLLTHEEQRRWKLIRENGYVWKGIFRSLQGTGLIEEFPGEQRWFWRTNENMFLIHERLREHWDSFVAVARDEAPMSVLPTWLKSVPADDPRCKVPTGLDFDYYPHP